MKVCEKYPAALQQMARIASKAFNGAVGDAAAKNGRPASALFSADAVIRQLGLSNGSGSANLAELRTQPDLEPKP